jgi:D-alanyl-D-alanine dipeptidase
MRRLLFLVLLFSSYVAAQTAQSQFFHITPVRPVEELRKEALKAQPPVEHGEFLKPDLVELVKLDPSIKLDIRYATSRNFLSTPVYEEARAFMQRPAAEAVARASEKLHAKGFGLLIHDAYRPWYVTKIFWDATPPEDHKFVADPTEGSRHNRGCAVDLTMYDLKTGEAVPMTGLYDEMSERSYPNYKGGTEEERRNRETLRAAMEAEGFTVYEFEWWHFDYKDYKKYPILNLRFEDILAGAKSKTSKVYFVGHGVTAPEPLVQEQPDVIQPNRTVKKTASALLQFVVKEDGGVGDVKVLRLVGYGLDEKAVAAVQTWKFRPATLNGMPVAVRLNVEIKFHMY